MKSINEMVVVLVITLIVLVACATVLDTEYNRSHTRMEFADFYNTLKGE